MIYTQNDLSECFILLLMLSVHSADISSVLEHFVHGVCTCYRIYFFHCLLTKDLNTSSAH